MTWSRICDFPFWNDLRDLLAGCICGVGDALDGDTWIALELLDLRGFRGCRGGTDPLARP